MNETETKMTDQVRSWPADGRTGLGDWIGKALGNVERTGRPESAALVGVPTGFDDLDALTGGLRPGMVYALIGATGVGTSTLALDFARCAAIKHGIDTLVLSAQSPGEELGNKILSAEARVPSFRLRSNTMTDDDWTRVAGRLEEIAAAPLAIDDRSYRDFNTIAKDLVRQSGGYRLIIVDGVNLFARPTAPETLWAAHTRVSADIKRLAVELAVPIVITAPVNRRIDNRIDPRPTLADISSSSAYAADADVVIGVHREDHYCLESPRAGEADLIVLKNRYGPVATVVVAFQRHYCRFIDMAT